MRLRTIGVVLIVMVALGAVSTYTVMEGTSSEQELTVRWISDPPSAVGGNHHPPAATHWNGSAFIVSSINGRQSARCIKYFSVLDGKGNERWHDQTRSERCFKHGVSDPTIADFDRDGQPEVIATTTEQALVAYDRHGRVELRHPLTTYGYSKPLVANLTPTPGPETIVNLLDGVLVLRPNGTEAWTKNLDNTRVHQPAVRDVDADGTPELAVGQRTGEVIVFEQNGRVAWRTNLSNVITMRSLVTGQIDDDAATELLVTTYAGDVIALDGNAGRIEWRRTLNATSAITRTVDDGDGDGKPEVYVATRDNSGGNNTIRSLNAGNGSVEWTTTLSTGTVASVPPPSLADLDGDDATEVVAVSNSGRVAIIDPSTGDIVASYERDVPIKTFARLADINEDGASEILLMYADGRIVALSYT